MLVSYMHLLPTSISCIVYNMIVHGPFPTPAALNNFAGLGNPLEGAEHHNILLHGALDVYFMIDYKLRLQTRIVLDYK